MKKRMSDLENQIALQSENYKKISMSSNLKEEQLNKDINEYINQINDLKNEMEVLNNIITNLTEEKENNTIKITNLLQENEKLKKEFKNNDDNNNILKSSKITETPNDKNYEEILLKLKKKNLELIEEKKALEDVIFKRESDIKQLSSKLEEVEKKLLKKNKELEESIEYTAKLTSLKNFHQNEILKIKQKQSDNNKNDKTYEEITNLQNELQNIKKNLKLKESKLNNLSSKNKILQDKFNKLTLSLKNEIICNNKNDSKYNNNKNKNNIHSSYNNYNSNKISISKPQSQLKNKTTRMAEGPNPISSNILPKNNIDNNIDIHKNNHLEKSPNRNKKNIDDNKLFIVSKNKIKSKTPSYLINSKQQIPEKKSNLNRPNNEISNKNNEKNSKNLVSLCPDIYNPQKSLKNTKLNIEEKYKQIESKYKNEKKEITKEDTLFNEEDISNIKKDIITPSIQLDEDIDSVPMFNNINSQIMKTKKEGRNTKESLYKKNIEQNGNISQEKEFPIIESYCMLYDKDNQNKSGYNYNTNECSINKNITINNDREKSNESKIEAKQVQDLKEHVNKILKEF